MRKGKSSKMISLGPPKTQITVKGSLTGIKQNTQPIQGPLNVKVTKCKAKKKGMLDNAMEAIVGDKVAKGKASHYRIIPEPFPKRCCNMVNKKGSGTKQCGSKDISREFEVSFTQPDTDLPPELWHIHKCKTCGGKIYRHMGQTHHSKEFLEYMRKRKF